MTAKKESAAEVAARLNAPYPKGSERYVVKQGQVVDLLGHGEKVQQLTVQFGAAAKRYMEAAQRQDVKALLAEGVKVTEAMERVAKCVTFTEVM